MHAYDAIVVGAGPAGCTAAAVLARSGARVALLEKHALPRHKTCGGGMPSSISRFVELPEYDGLPPFVECVVARLRCTWRYGRTHVGELNAPGVTEPVGLWMTQRSRFDHALALHASSLGADVRDALPVHDVEIGRNEVRVAAGNGGTAWSGTCRTLIGADGANGVVARAAGLRRNRLIAVGTEVELPLDNVDRSARPAPDTACLEFGDVAHGYAWVFPKADHLNIGAGVFRPGPAGSARAGTGTELRDVIHRYTASIGGSVPDSQRYYSHGLPVYSGRENLHAAGGRVLLCGDAAGMISPFFGDGILSAARTGRIASECVLAGAESGYTRRVRAEVGRDFDSALRLARFFYQWPAICYPLITQPQSAQTAARLLSGGLKYGAVASNVLRRLRYALANAA